MSSSSSMFLKFETAEVNTVLLTIHLPIIRLSPRPVCGGSGSDFSPFSGQNRCRCHGILLEGRHDNRSPTLNVRRPDYLRARKTGIHRLESVVASPASGTMLQ